MPLPTNRQPGDVIRAADINGISDAVNDAVVGAGTTAGRPAASSVAIGARYYDTTLNKPIYSNGVEWRDAAGTVV